MSRSIVLRVFTEGTNLDENKRRRILISATKLGYHPNLMAAATTGVRSNLVALVTGEVQGELDNAFSATLVSSLNGAGKWPVLYGGGEGLPDEAMFSTLQYPLDAIIIRGGSVDPELVDPCLKHNSPTIVSGHVIDTEDADCVCCKNDEDTAMAADLLFQRRRYRFGCVGGPPDWSPEQQRLSGVLRALAGRGLAPFAQAHADFTYAGGLDAARSLLEHSPDFEALICANDAMALAALTCLRLEGGVDVSGQISVVGFDDIATACWPESDLHPLQSKLAERLPGLERRGSGGGYGVRIGAPGEGPGFGLVVLGDDVAKRRARSVK